MTNIVSEEKEKVPSECDYPMCPAAKDANFELERHKEVRKDLDEIKTNQGVIAGEVRAAVMELKQLAVLFSEQTHIKEDLNKLGDKIRHIEESVVIDIYKDIKTIGSARLSWAQSLILIMVSGGIFGIGGFILSRLWDLWKN